MTVELAVVVVTYNSAHVIEELLASTREALAGVTADVVVVDNGSTDGTVELVEQSLVCRLIKSTNIGYAAAINLGIRQAEQSEAIMVLNPDLVLGAGMARILLDGLSLPNTGIVAPKMFNADGSLEEVMRREPSIPRALGLSKTGIPSLTECLNRPGDHDLPGVADWAVGAALLFTRICFDVVGGWDESYFLFSEETEFCLRARDLGFLTRYEPRAIVTHLAGGSGRDSRTQAMQAINRVRLYRRRHGLLASGIYYSLTVARELRRVRRNDGRHRAAVAALLRPSLRPAELNCSDRLIPV